MPLLADETGLPEVAAAIERLLGTSVVDAMAREHFATGGKRLRARLALSACEALGGRRLDAVGWAAACEIAHNATLVHDDVQDGDAVRRGQPTVWKRHGVAHAINTGDLLFMLAVGAVDLTAAAEGVRYRLVQALGAHIADVVRGQAEEQELIRGPLTAGAYEHAVRGKTSALFVLPVLGAAQLAGKQLVESLALAEPFADLGVLFQMQDDVLDLYGDKGREGPGFDLYEGKISCLVVAHLELHPEDRARVLALLGTPRDATEASEVRATIARFREGGALARVISRIDGLRRDLVGGRGLEDEPALAALLAELCDTVLTPIAHLPRS